MLKLFGLLEWSLKEEKAILSSRLRDFDIAFLRYGTFNELIAQSEGVEVDGIEWINERTSRHNMESRSILLSLLLRHSVHILHPEMGSRLIDNVATREPVPLIA